MKNYQGGKELTIATQCAPHQLWGSALFGYVPQKGH